MSTTIITESREEKDLDRLAFLLSSQDGTINLSATFNTLWESGLKQSDPRLVTVMEKVRAMKDKTDIIENQVHMNIDTFKECLRENFPLIQRGFTGELVIPEFSLFCERITSIYNLCKGNDEGKVSHSIPQLARYSPDNFGVSVCSVDGQRFNIGQTDIAFPIESGCKPINYSLALSDMSSDEVHKYIGQEPSGDTFDEIKLDLNNRPHNPMINTGAIVCASLLKNKEQPADRFDYVLEQYKRLAGGDYIGYNNSVFLSERAQSDRDYALGYYLKEYKCFPEHAKLQETMEFYFQLCSMELNTESGSVIAATLANGGVCPLTNDSVIDGEAVRDTLSLMHSCGMYDYTGKFAFKVGLPGKSSVSGLILLVVPNICGICVWSPPLDEFGNSVRGIQFCEELVDKFNFHEYDNLRKSVKRYDPRNSTTHEKATLVGNLHFGAYNGDLTALRRWRNSCSRSLLMRAPSSVVSQSGGWLGHRGVIPGAHTDMMASSDMAFHRDSSCRKRYNSSPPLCSWPGSCAWYSRARPDPFHHQPSRSSRNPAGRQT